MSIFALATAPGTSGLAVIRVSGKDAFKVAKALTKFKKIKPRESLYAYTLGNSPSVSLKGLQTGIYIHTTCPTLHPIKQCYHRVWTSQTLSRDAI